MLFLVREKDFTRKLGVEGGIRSVSCLKWASVAAFSRGIPGIEPLDTSVSQKHQSKLNVDHGLNKSNLF